MYKVQFSKSCCLKYFDKLPKDTKVRILKFIQNRVAVAPHEVGDPLKGPLAGFWRARVGDYRIVYEIHEEVVMVLVIKIDHRKDVYL